MRAAILLALLLAPTTARAEWIDGNDLHEWCSTSSLQTACMGYVLGAVDGAALRAPPNATRKQITDVVKKYLEENPQSRNLPAAFLVTLAILKAWPSYNNKAKE